MVNKPIIASGAETLDAWKQFGCMLFDTSGEQPLETLQERLQETSLAQASGPGGAQVLIEAGALARAIERYSRQLQQRANSEREVMRGFVLALIHHSECVHTEAAETAQLAQVRSHLELGHPDDPELLRQLVSGCLSSLQQSFRQKQNSQEALIASLRGRIKLLEQSGSSAPPAPGAAQAPAPAVVSDPCTGLPARSEAEVALQRIAGAPQSYIAVFYIHRMNLINARFGEEVGSEIIVSCSQHIATALIRPADLLFRWSGPVFVAILEREESPQAVVSEVRRLVSAPLSRFFDNSSRTMYVPIRLTAETFPAANQDHTTISEQITNFVHSASLVG